MGTPVSVWPGWATITVSFLVPAGRFLDASYSAASDRSCARSDWSSGGSCWVDAMFALRAIMSGWPGA